MKSKSVREKAMDYLAIRDHSRAELQRKLEQKKYAEHEIQTALDQLEQTGLLKATDTMAQQVYEALTLKNKSHAAILVALEAKGLPPVSYSIEDEIQKAKNLIASSLSKLSNSSDLDKKQMAHFLKNRGFDMETINAVVPLSSDHFDDFP